MLGRGESINNKFRKSLSLLVAMMMMKCAENRGEKIVDVIFVKWIKGRLNRLFSSCVGDLVTATGKKWKPDLRTKVMHAAIVRQRKPLPQKGLCLHVFWRWNYTAHFSLFFSRFLIKFLCFFFFLGADNAGANHFSFVFSTPCLLILISIKFWFDFFTVRFPGLLTSI